MRTKTRRKTILVHMWQAGRRLISLEHSPAEQFACCQWQRTNKPSTIYLIYRCILFTFVLAVGIASFVYQRPPPRYEGPKVEINYFKWLIYFTNWGFVMITLQAGLALAVVKSYSKHKNSLEDDGTLMQVWPRTPLLCRAYWLAQNIATDLAFVITLIYWTQVHDPKIHDVNALNLLVHGGNSLIMFLELLVTSHPVRMAHALYGVVAGITYGVFSAIYWALGGTDRLGQPAIYPALDWNNSSLAMCFVGKCALVLVLSHILAKCIVAVRIWMAKRLRRQSRGESLPIHNEEHLTT